MKKPSKRKASRKPREFYILISYKTPRYENRIIHDSAEQAVKDLDFLSMKYPHETHYIIKVREVRRCGESKTKNKKKMQVVVKKERLRNFFRICM